MGLLIKWSFWDLCAQWSRWEPSAWWCSAANSAAETCCAGNDPLMRTKHRAVPRRTLRLFRGLRVLVQACLLARSCQKRLDGVANQDIRSVRLQHSIHYNTSTGQLQLKSTIENPVPKFHRCFVLCVAKYPCLAPSLILLFMFEVIRFCPRCAGPWYFLQSSWSWAPWCWETCCLVEFPGSALIMHPYWLTDSAGFRKVKEPKSSLWIA